MGAQECSGEEPSDLRGGRRREGQEGGREEGPTALSWGTALGHGLYSAICSSEEGTEGQRDRRHCETGL